MKPAVFYHAAFMGNGYDSIVTEQLELLAESDLRDINVTAVGNPAGLLHMGREAHRLGVNVRLLKFDPNAMHYETFAMLEIERWAKDGSGNALYLHTKGASSPGHSGKRRWRKLMEKELVSKWAEHVPLLPENDAVGVNWRDMPPVSHFCGNFWLASADYLKTLSGFVAYHNARKLSRLNCEFWIGSSSRTPKVVSLVHRNVDYCSNQWFGRP